MRPIPGPRLQHLQDFNTSKKGSRSRDTPSTDPDERVKRLADSIPWINSPPFAVYLELRKTAHKRSRKLQGGKRRGALLWQTASWWRSARISACRATRVRKLEATKGATKVQARACRAVPREMCYQAITCVGVNFDPSFVTRGIHSWQHS